MWRLANWKTGIIYNLARCEAHRDIALRECGATDDLDEQIAIICKYLKRDPWQWSQRAGALKPTGLTGPHASLEALDRALSNYRHRFGLVIAVGESPPVPRLLGYLGIEIRQFSDYDILQRRAQTVAGHVYFGNCLVVDWIGGQLSCLSLSGGDVTGLSIGTPPLKSVERVYAVGTFARACRLAILPSSPICANLPNCGFLHRFHSLTPLYLLETARVNGTAVGTARWPELFPGVNELTVCTFDCIQIIDTGTELPLHPGQNGFARPLNFFRRRGK